MTEDVFWYTETHNISHPNLAFRRNCANPKIALGDPLNRKVIAASVILLTLRT